MQRLLDILSCLQLKMLSKIIGVVNHAPLVFKPIQAALTLGSTGIEIQASGRNVTFQPALLVTLFMNVKGEVKAEVSAEYALPKYHLTH